MALGLLSAFTFLMAAASANAMCVITESGYRECFRPLDAGAVDEVTSFDPLLAGLRFEPPARIDVRAELASGSLIPEDLRRHTLTTFALLVIDQIRVDLGRPEIGGEVERPFIARVTWARAANGRSGATRVHGRVRQVRVTGARLSDGRDSLAKALTARLKIDLLVGNRGLANSEAARRRLVRDVLFPTVIAYGLR